MPQRYARIDVEFFHKNTSAKLLEQLGPWGPLVFIALILKAKDGAVPGTFTYSSDAVAWEKLGFDGSEVPFDLDRFFTVLGRVKQSSRRRNGRVWNVQLTRYADWQKDAKRYEEAAKKARTRAHSTGDTTGDTQGTQPGTRKGQKGGPRSRTRSTPKPPSSLNGKTHVCRHCHPHIKPFPTRALLLEHLENVHGEIPNPLLDDDLLPADA